MSREYSKEIAQAIIDFAEKEGYHYTFNKEEGYFDLTFETDSVFGYIHFTLKVREDSVISKGFVDMVAKEENRLAVLEYMNRVNCGLAYSGFQMDMEDGEILYKYTAYVGEGRLTEDEIDHCFTMSIYAYDVYGNELLNVMMGLKSAKEAYNDAEKESDESENEAAKQDNADATLHGAGVQPQ